MKKLFLFAGLAIFFIACSDSSTGTGHTESGDTTKNMTTNAGAAGTGGVGAGYGSGGSAGTDTNTTPGAAKDTATNGNQR